MDIAVIGTGYVGLVSGTCFAEMGHEVTCVDVDKEKVAQLSSGEVPIYEPDLDRYFERARAEGRLHFTTDLAKGVADAKIVFFALPHKRLIEPLHLFGGPIALGANHDAVRL